MRKPASSREGCGCTNSCCSREVAANDCELFSQFHSSMDSHHQSEKLSSHRFAGKTRNSYLETFTSRDLREVSSFRQVRSFKQQNCFVISFPWFRWRNASKVKVTSKQYLRDEASNYSTQQAPSCKTVFELSAQCFEIWRRWIYS